MAKVSVLIPVYNTEIYLRECLDSVINQTLEDIEIICINDGSTDDSLSIMQEYAQKDKRIKIIDKQNTGYGHSMNIGLDRAEGEYIGILEPDDFTDIHMFEDLYGIAKEKDCDIVKSDYYRYHSKTGEKRKAGNTTKFACGEVINLKENEKLLRLPPAIWSSIYKREFLKTNNIRFLGTPGASYQDTSFNYKTMLAAERICLTKRAYVCYRQDNPNSSIKSKDKVYAICDEYDEIERFLSSKPKLEKNFSEYMNAVRYRAYFETMMRIDEKYIEDFVEVFSAKFRELYERNELGRHFYLRNKKMDVLCLLNDKQKFLEFYKKEKKRHDYKRWRRNLVSVNIDASRISIILFDRQIAGIELCKHP